MKLRSKKTGEVGVINEIIHITKENDICCGLGSYNSLAELNAEWEDYNPKEPLIKDELIRRAIRTWARVNDIPEVKFDADWNSFRYGDVVIGFCFDFTDFDDLGDGKEYTIAELCGEEE